MTAKVMGRTQRGESAFRRARALLAALRVPAAGAAPPASAAGTAATL